MLIPVTLKTGSKKLTKVRGWEERQQRSEPGLQAALSRKLARTFPNSLGKAWPCSKWKPVGS